MSLSKKQMEFTSKVGLLIAYADSLGYGLTFGDAFRNPTLHGQFGVKKSYAHANSLHKIRLAVDFNLFVNGEWISDGEHIAWHHLGEYWESLHEEARWGGRFNDANHFSFEHWGVK